MPPSSSAAATLSSIPSAKKAWISSFEAPLSRLTDDVQLGELLADDLPDVLVAAGRVGLQLDAEQVAIGQELHVGVAHQVEDRAVLVVGRAAPGGLVEDEPGPLEAVPDDGEEQLPLRPEQLEQVRLRDADGPRDRLGRGAACSRPAANSWRAATMIASRRSSAVWRGWSWRRLRSWRVT